MQVEFDALRWCNFLSTGNEWTEIRFDSPTTLVVGENGAGKSTMLDALFFVLFDKPFRPKVKKGQLVNTITRKGALVEVEFRRGAKRYLVRRGIKPNLFEVEVDGVPLDQSDKRSDSFDLQQVIRLNRKSGGNVMVLGSANYTPFMQLDAADRRQVIEDLLDLQVFSVMNSLLKDRVSGNKSELERVDTEVRHVRDKLSLIDKHLEQLRSTNVEQVEAHERRIAELAAEACVWVEEMGRLQADLDSAERPDTRDIVARRRRLDVEKSNVVAERNVKAREASFLTEHQNCPTCHQEINEDFRAAHCMSANEQIAALDLRAAELDLEISAINRELDDAEAASARVSELETEVRTLRGRCDQNRKLILSIQCEVHRLQQRNTHMDTEAGPELKTREVQLLSERAELSRDRETLLAASALLKDGGIKARVIKQYVPVINQLINKYLAQLDFYVDFNLDEEFNERILSRNRDDFCYEMFSEGEKMRIDLALLFAWRSIAKARASVSTNLLIFDEIMDSSLDGHGADEFVKMLNSLTDDTKVVLISHRGDQLADRFSSVIRFEKTKNFSRIAS